LSYNQEAIGLITKAPINSIEQDTGDTAGDPCDEEIDVVSGAKLNGLSSRSG
jgi:hypothetical protein